MVQADDVQYSMVVADDVQYSMVVADDVQYRIWWWLMMFSIVYGAG